MKKSVLLKKLVSPREVVLLDTEHGTFSDQPGEAVGTQGTYALAAGQQFAVFAAEQALYLQWNGQRWNLQGLGGRISYEHDFRNKTTTFAVDGTRIEYPAWWADDPTFDPSLPELDEDEDFLAYVANLAGNEELQRSLIKAWA